MVMTDKPPTHVFRPRGANPWLRAALEKINEMAVREAHPHDIRNAVADALENGRAR
jgi:hypothetical protein